MVRRIPVEFCHYCTNEATHVYKAHAPLLGKSAEYSNFVTIFLCRDHIEQDVRHSEERMWYDGQQPIERYVRIRFAKAEHDTLPDNWEKEWTYAYYWKGYHYYYEPSGKVYWTGKTLGEMKGVKA